MILFVMMKIKIIYFFLNKKKINKKKYFLICVIYLYLLFEYYLFNF